MRIGKKGVSEILAATLLITITVSAATIFYLYSSNLLGSLTGAQPQSGQYTNQISLEYYDWTNTGLLKLTIRNVGSGLANIAAYYVSGTKIIPTSSICTSVSGTFTTTIATTTVSTYSYTLTQGPLLPQASCTVILTITGLTIMAGVAYSVRIATSNGGVFAYTCVAGQRTGSY